MITHERLLELYRYEPDTGHFIRKVKQKGRSGPVGSICGSKRPDGYIFMSVDGERVLAHRLAYFYMTGEWPEDQIDHINGDNSDNRWVNLRPATRTNNTRNRRGHSRLGVKGIGQDKGRSRYFAKICVNGKRIYLGSFKTAEEAKEAYDKAANEHFGEFARTA